MMTKVKGNNKAVIISVIAICILGMGMIFSGCNSNTTTSNENIGEVTTEGNIENTTLGNTSEQLLDSELTYYAKIDIKNYGTITVKLDPESAPITVENFVSLAESGFYDGLTFHRIIADFMMQGGDPSGNGTGGSAEKIVGEFSANGYSNNLSHTRGAISMARSSEYNSASSQFFIVHKDSTYLDGQYAVFGYVTEGMDVVDAVCEAANPIDGNGTISASEQPVINSVKIVTD